MRQNRRVAPIVLPASLETFISQHVGHDDISEACPLALVRLAARRNEVSRFEPNPQPPPNRGGSRNPVFTRLCRRLSEAVHKERQGTCSLGQDGASSAFGLGSLRPIFFNRDKGFRSSEQSMRNERRGMVSYWFDFRKTSTDAPATASTPGKECLTGQERLAKGILSSISIFRARSHLPAYA